VRSRLDIVGKNGGLIIGPTHHVQLDTPLENFWAMVNTITGKNQR
jgi:uroporphyrinogen decarboxylase